MAQARPDTSIDRTVSDHRPDLRLFTWKVLIAVGIAALAFLVWQVAHALLLVFAGVLFAIFLLRVVGALRRWTGLGHGWALATVLLVLAGALVLLGWLAGSTVSGQFDQLSRQIGSAIEGLPPDLHEQLTQAEKSVPWLSGVRSVVTSIFYFLGNLVIVLFAGIYLAASPDLYRRGVVLLVPPAGHPRAWEVLDTSGHALWRWLIGQLASMAGVAVLVTVSLWMLGVPAALALGLIAGALEFIPLIGPVIAAVPAVLIAFSQDPTLALWVALAYLVIQQIEGNLILPMAQKTVVHLPPVVTLAAVAAGGLLFGILGMFLATPLAVFAMVLVNMLYVEDRLGQKRHFPE